MIEFDKIVIVTKKTWLEELIERFNTKSQAKFYIEHMGGSFEEYEQAHAQYYESLDTLKKSIPQKIRFQVVEKNFLPNFLFGNDLIIVIGQDGLVINTAKYLDNQVILAVNPDPQRFEGRMLPFEVYEVGEELLAIEKGVEVIDSITMAKVELNDGQYLYGVNDLFIGHRSHGSARYDIEFRNRRENHSSSGIIVSTGAGSTAWFRSIISGSYQISNRYKKGSVKNIPTEQQLEFPWDSRYIYFSVREPWVSKTSSANIVFDKIHNGDILTLTSKMPEEGVIFSDGIEKDFIEFNSGAIAKIRVAKKRANLLVHTKSSQSSNPRDDW